MDNRRINIWGAHLACRTTTRFEAPFSQESSSLQRAQSLSKLGANPCGHPTSLVFGSPGRPGDDKLKIWKPKISEILRESQKGIYVEMRHYKTQFYNFIPLSYKRDLAHESQNYLLIGNCPMSQDAQSSPFLISGETKSEIYSSSHHVIVGMFPAQKGRGMFEDTLRVLPVPKGDDPLGDVTELHHLRHATSALSRSRHRWIRADTRRPRRCWHHCWCLHL